MIIGIFKPGESSKGKVKGGFMATNSLKNKKQTIAVFRKADSTFLHKKTTTFDNCNIILLDRNV